MRPRIPGRLHTCPLLLTLSLLLTAPHADNGQHTRRPLVCCACSNTPSPKAELHQLSGGEQEGGLQIRITVGPQHLLWCRSESHAPCQMTPNSFQWLWVPLPSRPVDTNSQKQLKMVGMLSGMQQRQRQAGDAGLC